MTVTEGNHREKKKNLNTPNVASVSYTMVKKSNTEIKDVTYNSNGDTNETTKPVKQVINE